MEGDKHANLLREKGGTAFPTLLFLDAEGNVVTKQTERSVAGFERTLHALTSYAGAKAKAEAGDPAAKVEVFLAEVALGKILNYEVAKGRVAELGELDAEQRRRVDGAVTDLEVAYLQRRRQDADATGKRFAEMLRQGHVPSGSNATYFWRTLLTWADKAGDADILEMALQKSIEAQFGRYQKRLAELRKKDG